MSLGIPSVRSLVLSCPSQWIYPVSEALYYPKGAKVSMTAAVIIFTFPWVLDYMVLRANKQREKKMAELPADHVFPEGQSVTWMVRFDLHFASVYYG